MPLCTAGPDQILRMVESGAGSNGRGRRGSRPRRPPAGWRGDWPACAGMACAGTGDDTLVSKSLARAAGMLAPIPGQQSPAERIGEGSEPSWRHSFAAASGPHHALHNTPASGPAAKVRAVRRMEARNMVPSTHQSKNGASGRREHFRADRHSCAKFSCRAAEYPPALIGFMSPMDSIIGHVAFESLPSCMCSIITQGDVDGQARASIFGLMKMF